MESLLHADVFFFVTTVAIISVTLVLTAILAYGIGIARNIYRVTSRIREEGDAVIADVRDFRTRVKRDGFRMSKIISFISALRARPAGKRGRKINKKEES
jgi:hypothetical protein